MLKLTNMSFGMVRVSYVLKFCSVEFLNIVCVACLLGNVNDDMFSKCIHSDIRAHHVFVWMFELLSFETMKLNI